MDIPGFHLSAYRKVHPDLRPQIDHDLVGDLMCLVQEGSRGAAKKAAESLRMHLETARHLRDLELQAGTRRAIRLWEALNVDEDSVAQAYVKTNAPACFELDEDRLDAVVGAPPYMVCQ